MQQKKNKKERGITLIALVVTIIVLIILAGVSINLVFGNLGVVTKAKEAKELQKQAQANEQIALEEVSNEIDTMLGTDATKNNPKFTTVANAPDVSGFNKSNTYYVAWDLTSSPYQINEDTNLNGIAPSNWYDYTEGINHWANVKTTGGGNDCYWVWIPRYAYCITTGYHSNTAGTIDIKFLQGTTNTPIDGSNITISNSSGSENWNVHPAFWWDKNNNGIEDEGEQLTGIWVAKYEASSSNVSEINLENGVLKGDTASLSGTGGGDTNSLQVRVKPNVTSWRGITVNNMFTVCRNLTQTGNSLENTTNLNSHMMKNIEWGACAYLSRSVYGKNSEVWNNPYYNNTTNYSPITGLCGNESIGKDGETTDITKTYKYNEIGGKNASTTGNVYGIYDMAGGAIEYVAGIYTGGAFNDNRSKLLDSNNSKYVDKYTNTTGSQSPYYGNTDKYGEAVYETSSSGDSGIGSWDYSDSVFPYSAYPVFVRGGRAIFGSRAGVFSFNSGTGGTYTSYSFRPVVLSSQP